MRATVTADRRRVDVRVPDGVPVVELVPGLAGRLGATGDDLVLLTADGRPLEPGRPLADQGVVDGAVLGLADAGASLPQRYDDLAEAVADAVHSGQPRLPPGAGRRIARSVAVASAAAGVAALAAAPWSAATSAVGFAVALLGLAVGWAWRTEPVGVAPVWAASAYAAVGAFALVAGDAGPERAWPAAGAAAAAFGVAGACALGDPVPAGPPAAVGLLLVALGGLATTTGFELAILATVAMVLVVLGQSGLGWLALTATGADADPPVTDPAAPRTPVDPGRVADRVATAGRILVAATLTVGAVLAVGAPYSVATGTAGSALAAACAGVVLLRTRHLHGGRAVVAGLAAGLAGLAATGIAVVVQHPEARPATAVAVAGVAAVVFGWTHAAPRPSLRRTRIADLAETTLVLALLPLLAVATGLAGWVVR